MNRFSDPVRNLRRARRRGAVLVLVLVLIPVLAFGAYSFTHWMRAESRAAVVSTQRMQARWLADAGVQRVRALLAQPEDENDPLDLNDNPVEFAAQELMVDQAGVPGLFTILAPMEDGSDSVRYGLVDESTKIPLNNPQLQLSRESLMGLEGMTEEIADAILDWIDSDDEPKDYGAELDYYMSLSQPYQPRNATPLSIGELLLVKGVTPYLLYGEDVNLDGVLNPNEDDGDESWPPDNADGKLQRGWYPYLTFYSADVNLTPEGEPKINITEELKEEDETKLVESFGEEFVTFLKAYKTENRQIKAISELINASVEIEETEDPDGDPNQGRSRGQRGGAPDAGGAGDGAPNEQNNRNGRPQKITIRSPWTKENMGEYLEKALQTLSVSAEPVRKGVINVNKAPAFVLRALPEISQEQADDIANRASSRGEQDATVAWLLLENVLELEQFQKIEPFVTTQGRVFRVESVGFFENQGPVVRMEAWIDATASVPQVILKRELSAQGSAYPREVLLGTQTNY